jgi:hypothetical protein
MERLDLTKLVDRALFEACIEILGKDRVQEILGDVVKGDLPGHEFRGNQYTSGVGGGEQPSSKEPASVEVLPPQDVIAGVELPRSHEDFPRFVAEMKATPEYKEVSEKLAGLQEKSDALGRSRDITRLSQEMRTDANGNYTPEAQAEHDRIVKEMFNEKAAVPEGQRPQAVFLIGSSGSGKTTSGLPYLQKKGLVKEYTYINADDAKEKLSGYEGWNAPMLHEESTDIAEKELTTRAVNANHNIVFDLTGKNTDKMLAVTDWLKKHDYDIHVVHTEVPSFVSAGRCWKRYNANPMGKDPSKPPGRWVDPEFAYSKVDHKPAITFSKLMEHPDIGFAVQLNTLNKPATVDKEKKWGKS